MNNKENSLLNERYRPLTLDKFVGNEHLKTAISGYLEKNDILNFIFYGLTNKSYRVYILNLITYSERSTGSMKGYVSISTQAALLHIPITCAQVSQDRPKFLHISHRFS